MGDNDVLNGPLYSLCSKGVQMHYQFVAMNCQMHCQYFLETRRLTTQIKRQYIPRHWT